MGANDKTIAGITTSASTLDGTELMHIMQGGNSRKATTGGASGGLADLFALLSSASTQAIASGFSGSAYNDGTATGGTYTPGPAGGNLRRIINGGAFALAAPTASGDYTLVILITNNGSAGAITLSGFTKTDGASFTTTNTHSFLLFITKINGLIHCNVVALQ